MLLYTNIIHVVSLKQLKSKLLVTTIYTLIAKLNRQGEHCSDQVGNLIGIMSN
jgi:hypothetical protein